MQARVNKNRTAGAFFEKVFQMRARCQQLLCVRNGQECRFVGNDRVLPIKSNLDWTLIDAQGRLAFCDTKVISGERFSYSQMPVAQMQRVNLYARYNVRAGFVVHLRELNQVVWFSAQHLAQKGPRSSYGVTDGRALGCLSTFDPSGILS